MASKEMAKRRKAAGDAIRAERVKLGISQAQLAEKLNVGKSFMAQIEQGNVAIPVRVRGLLRGMFDIRALWVCDHCGSEVEE